MPQEEERVAKKLYVSLILHEIINEVPMDKVLAKYAMNRNSIARLQVGHAPDPESRGQGLCQVLSPKDNSKDKVYALSMRCGRFMPKREVWKACAQA